MPQDERPVTLFIGDSFTSGWALAPHELPRRFTSVLAATLGWDEANAGCPGSGYVASGPVCKAPYRVIAGRHIDVRPDIVIVSGGLNDIYAGAERARNEAARTMRRLAELFPTAMRIAICPFAAGNHGVSEVGADPADEAGAAVLGAIAEALHASAHGATVIDAGQPLANRGDLLLADGMHPSVEGHGALADAIAQEFARIGLN